MQNVKVKISIFLNGIISVLILIFQKLSRCLLFLIKALKFGITNKFARIIFLYIILDCLLGRYWKLLPNSTYNFWILTYALQLYLYGALLWIFIHRKEFSNMKAEEEKLCRSYLWALVGVAIFQLGNQCLKQYDQTKWDIIQLILPTAMFFGNYAIQTDNEKITDNKTY